jgi:hypothetical protein
MKSIYEVMFSITRIELNGTDTNLVNLVLLLNTQVPIRPD